jgi:hypothetical protein
MASPESLGQAHQTSVFGHSNTMAGAIYDDKNNIIGYYTDPYDEYGAYSPPSSTEACIIKLPHNETYTTHNITLVLTTGCHCFYSFGRYSLDGEPETTINTDGGYGIATFNTTVYLKDGNHSLHLDEYSLNLEASATVYFNVNTSLPFIALESPQNQIYHNSTIDLNYTLVDKERFEAKYSLDNKENLTVSNRPGVSEKPQLGNLTDGTHHITVYAEDDFGNVYSKETSFEVKTNSLAGIPTMPLLAIVALIITVLTISLIIYVFMKRRILRQG